jgi:hypothetical protein
VQRMNGILYLIGLVVMALIVVYGVGWRPWTKCRGEVPSHLTTGGSDCLLS